MVRKPYCGAIGGECTEENAISVNDEVEFYVTNTESQELMEEINSWYPDDYTNKNIRLGCLENEVITYINAADEFVDPEIGPRDGGNQKSFVLSSSDTSEIINSSENNLIVLKLTKLKLSIGGEAPACYSHFANFEVVK